MILRTAMIDGTKTGLVLAASLQDFVRNVEDNVVTQ